MEQLQEISLYYKIVQESVLHRKAHCPLSTLVLRSNKI